jgi:hypothetical protein
MKNKIVYFSEFKFNTLRKFMSPFYSTLNQHLDWPIENKKTLIYKIIPAFCVRLREYRNRTLEEIAEKNQIAIDVLKKFETSPFEFDQTHVIKAYVDTCYGYDEFMFFREQLFEFLHPSLKESKNEIAGTVIRQFGIILPGVDYKNLSAKRGVVVPFHGKEKLPPGLNVLKESPDASVRI